MHIWAKSTFFSPKWIRMNKEIKKLNQSRLGFNKYEGYFKDKLQKFKVFLLSAAARFSIICFLRSFGLKEVYVYMYIHICSTYIQEFIPLKGYLVILAVARSFSQGHIFLQFARPDF